MGASCCGGKPDPQDNNNTPTPDEPSHDTGHDLGSGGCCGGGSKYSSDHDADNRGLSGGCCDGGDCADDNDDDSVDSCGGGCCGGVKDSPDTAADNHGPSGGCCDDDDCANDNSDNSVEGCGGSCCGDAKDSNGQSGGCCDGDGCANDNDDKSIDGCGGGCCDDNGCASDNDDKSIDGCGGGCCGDAKDSNGHDADSNGQSGGCCGGDGCANDNGDNNVDSCPGGCCDDSPGDFSDDSASVTSDATTTCCGSEERCDESCIYAAAAIECGRACSDDPIHEKSFGHPHEHDVTGHRSDFACNSHRQAAFDKYSSYLEQLRCICRTMIDRGTASQDMCCAGNRTNKAALGRKKHAHGHKHKGRKARGGHRQKQITPKFEPSGRTAKTNKGGFEAESLEKGATETLRFVVSGMDCTSCADKLVRIFGSMTGVSRPRVNFVSGNGEIEVDTSITNADEVIAFATTASGFRLARMIGGDYFLDLLADQTESKLLGDHPPVGVTEVQSLDKKTIRLTYDPTVIGARDLYGSLEDRCKGLAPPRADPQLTNSRRRLRDQLAKTVLAAILTIPVCVVSFGDYLVSEKTGAIISLVLGTFVQAIAIPEFYQPALKALWYSHTVEMDMLVVMSITAAYLYSVVAFGFTMAGQPLEQEQFFETSTLLITLILAGRLVAAFARVQAVASVSLRSQQNSRAVLITKMGDEDMDARLLQYGDRFKVLPHSRIPTDGTVLSGKSEVDESMLTGEPMPVIKKAGDSLMAGTVNGDGTVVVALTRLPGRNTVTDIAQMVEDAANSKPQLQDLANKVASWFVPVMATIAILVFVVWIGCGIGVLSWGAGRSVGNAVTYTVATLAVACPCALGLAVPMVLVVAGGMAARGGVIIKSADTTERARKTTDVVFDKTGTITEGALTVLKAVSLHSDERLAMALTKAMVAGAKHPVSAAVERHLETQPVEVASDVANVRVIPGAGIEADYNGTLLRAGNARWTKTQDVPEVKKMLDAGLTTLVVIQGSTPMAMFGLRTQIRPEAIGVIAELKARNINVHLVSGDNIGAVKATAAMAGIPAENAVGERTPRDKQTYVAGLTDEPGKYVMFCGDGTNDAVAVAQAHVGVQMCGGTSLGGSDVTRSAADVILLKDLEGIPFLLNVSRAAFHRMAFNFGWSAVYNVLAVTMASGAWVRIRIPPAYAGLGEIVSVMPVILAAMSMLMRNMRYQQRAKPE